MDLNQIGVEAAAAAKVLAALSTKEKNAILSNMAALIRENYQEILNENAVDVEEARKKGTKESFIDRLRLTKERIFSMADGILEVAALQDPIGGAESFVTRPNGLQITKIRVPLGVIGIIYEARPNVTSDAAALCFKAGNAVILRGGSEAIRSNKKIVEIMQKSGIPRGAISLIEDTSRETATQFMRMREYLDVLIPRGGAGLINTVAENSSVPIIETGVGNCHVYVETSADLDMAEEIVFNAKTSRPSVCNAAEKLLVDERIAGKFLPRMIDRLIESGVQVRGCEKTQRICPQVVAATDEDWGEEYSDYIIAVKVVKDSDEAIAHINKYGTKHSEAIVTSGYNQARRFHAEVDAAAVYVNASTRFTDGNEFGLGAEIGISTQKMHARGPMGLNELTTTKFIIFGDGQVRK